MVTRHEPRCISVARCARIIFCSLKLSLPTPFAFLAPFCWVQLKTPHLAPSHPPAAGARSEQPRVSACRWVLCPGPPEKRASHLSRQVGPGELQHGPKRADRRDRGGQTGLPEGEVPRSTSSRCPIPTPLHQPALHYLSEGSIGSADLRKDVEQLKLLVEVRGVGQLDDLLCHSGGSCRAHPPKTRTTR